MESTKSLPRELASNARGTAVSATPSLDRIDVADPTRISGAVTTIDFHGLTRSVQERFVASMEARHGPMPIAVATVRSNATFVWTCVICMALAALAVLVEIG